MVLAAPVELGLFSLRDAETTPLEVFVKRLKKTKTFVVIIHNTKI
jgi:hypothetical protein